MEAIGRTDLHYELEATIIRADGTVIPLGTVATTRWNGWRGLTPKALKARGAARFRIYRANRSK